MRVLLIQRLQVAGAPWARDPRPNLAARGVLSPFQTATPGFQDHVEITKIPFSEYFTTAVRSGPNAVEVTIVFEESAIVLC